ncbi:MAG: hypothetical protein ABW041_07175 [Dehalococcoides mccartyi]
MSEYDKMTVAELIEVERELLKQKDALITVAQEVVPGRELKSYLPTKEKLLEIDRLNASIQEVHALWWQQAIENSKSRH